ncbi:hypothetical protein BASA81_014836, partial [Batrachochytrium salamandrivorans]
MSTVVLVTGASRGLGLAISKACLLQNAKVYGVGRSAIEALPAVQLLLQEYPSSFFYQTADLAIPGVPKQIVLACAAHFGSIGALVHNAGTLNPLARVIDMDLTALRQLMEVNVFAGIEMVQCALPMLRNADATSGLAGRVVMVSSGAALKAYEGWIPYCISKSAINMFVEGLAAEEPLVTCVAIRPGVVDTDMQQTIRNEGGSVMAASDYSKFIQMKESGELLSAEIPGAAIAKVAIHGTTGLSGKFINWN